MKYIPILLALSATSATTKPFWSHKTATDHYHFDQKEFEHLTPEVEFIIHPNIFQLQKAAKKSGMEEFERVRAFSVLKGKDYNKCVVHIIDPSQHYQPELIGHEVTHCMYGRWHKKN